MTDQALPRGGEWNRWAVFLDFDGTLAPLRDRPGDVSLPDRERRLVEKARDLTGGAVAVITGRALDDIAAMTAGLDLVLSGSHGVETRWPGQPPQMPEGVAAALAAPHRMVSAFAQEHGLLVELKPGAVALHYRGHEALGEACRATVDRAVEETAGAGRGPLEEAAPNSLPLRAMHGTLVSEVALAGIDKGTALRGLMQHPPFAGRLPLMAGDDVTDEDGIRAAQALGGVGVRIGGAETAAGLRFSRRDEFVDWLAEALG